MRSSSIFGSPTVSNPTTSRSAFDNAKLSFSASLGSRKKSVFDRAQSQIVIESPDVAAARHEAKLTRQPAERELSPLTETADTSLTAVEVPVSANVPAAAEAQTGATNSVSSEPAASLPESKRGSIEAKAEEKVSSERRASVRFESDQRLDSATGLMIRASIHVWRS